VAADILKDKIALVTAAGSGMGQRSCVRMAEEGAHVIVTDLDEPSAKATADEIKAAGGSAQAFKLDVQDLDELRAVADQVTAEHGALHVLFNHAGLAGPPGLEITPDEWTRTVDVNIRGAFFLTSYLLGALRAAHGASIIYTSSVVGLVGSQFSPLYSMVKGGLIAFTRAAALNLAGDQIRANTICPGPTDTPSLPSFFAPAPGETGIEQRKEAIFSAIPARRLGTPSDVAEAAVFLASDMSSYITGIALPVDGGYSAR
jgi:NAD(P)-dependent dehydrogenase (short-subunit alcohol dehydrogenase family)